MILFVVTETMEKYHKGSGWFTTKLVLEKHARDRCLLVHYSQLSQRLLRKYEPWAICHSGGGTPHDAYDVLDNDRYRWAIREYDAAQIGFCGGHQIMATYFGGTIRHMRKVRPDEPDVNPAYYPGQFKESGVYPVRVLKTDPLFDGLPDVIRVRQNHRSEVGTLGPDLDLLATAEGCRVQAYRHRDKPLYGTQFHPESVLRGYPDGFKILRNFFRIARDHARARV